MYSPIRGGSVSPIERSHTPQASDFPVPASQEFKVTKRDKGLVSPSQSSFSFIDEEDQPIHAITSPRRIESRTPSRAPSRGPSRKNSVDLSRARGASIDGAAGYLCNGIADDVVVQAEIGKPRNQFYTEVFAYREPNITPKDRIYSDAIVTVEVKTNVIVHDEYALLLSLSHQLSRLYHRPTTSIFLSLSHSACMLFGGTFDSAYILTITSLPSLLSPPTNKRNASLLQAFLADSLRVSPARGLVRFMAVPDEFLAFNGTTVGGQIENLKREEAEKEKEQEIREKIREREREKLIQEKEKKERDRKEKELELSSPPGPRPPLLKKHQSTKQYKMTPSNQHTNNAWLNGAQSASVPVSRAATPPCLPRIPTEKSGWIGAGGKGGWGEKKGRGGGEVGVGGRVVGKRKSFFNIFGSARREG